MEFTYIRNRIREYKIYSLVKEIIIILKESEKGEKNPIPIWEVLLLLKWSFQFAEQKYPAKDASRNDVVKLLMNIQELQDLNNYFTGHKEEGIIKLFNVLSYQQSYLQYNVWKDSFARQNLLFNELKSKYSIADVFKSNTGLTIQEFLKLNFILYTYVNPEKLKLDFHYNGLINSDYFNISKAIIEESKINLFLGLLTFPLEKREEIINKHNKVKSYNLQPFEISLFTLYPLLFLESNYLVIHRKLLNYSTNFFLYDYLKSIDNEKFSEEFGIRVEKYVELGLKEIGISYEKENELKKRFNGKVVDFVVDENILIECKAIEIEPYPSIYPDENVLKNWLKKSLIKAYCEQMLSVTSQISNHDEFWGIIMTYKETNFGTGLDAWDLFLKEPTISICNEKHYSYDKIPPENLFFIDLAVWDKIILIINEGKATLKQILINARENNKEDSSKLFLFSNQLDRYDAGAINQNYINEGYKFINDALDKVKD